MKSKTLLRVLRRSLLLSAAGLLAVGPARAAGEVDTEWWLKPRRMIQTNLREIDARMDLEAYVAALKDFGANVVLFNVGGIVANYPTDLPFHYRNPFMEGDLTGEVVKRLHAEGIRVIGRFDFSKVNEAIARAHPEWLSRGAQGAPYPPYNGQVPTCLNGGYQQEGMFRILDEALDRYPIDGVFFNMIGYPRSDYSGRPLGLCQCDGCRRRFREMYGLDLPRSGNSDDSQYAKYQEFCRRTVSEQFERVNGLVKGNKPGVAICTYTAAGVDLIRKESNRRHHQWAYEDSEKARLTRLDHPRHQLANAAVHFIHYPHRHAAVSPHLTQRRLLQQMVNGAWLDFYCIGPLHMLEDRLGLDELREVFHFHAANERWLLDTVELADVGLAVDGARDTPELRGLFRMLSESHVSFDLVTLERPAWARYPCVIVPVAEGLDATRAQRLDDYVQQGGRLLLTGPVPASLKCAGIRKMLEPVKPAQGTYVRIRDEDRQRLAEPLLGKLDLVFLDGELWAAECAPEVESLLRFIPPAMFGPPEKCYYTNVSDIPCLHFCRAGQGAVAWFPWRVGTHYEQQGHAGHAALVHGVLTSLLQAPRRVRLKGPSLLETNHRADPQGRFEWVSLINLSGEADKVLQAPLPVRNLRLELKPQSRVTSVSLLKAGNRIPFENLPDGWLSCVVPEVAAFEVVLFLPQ